MVALGATALGSIAFAGCASSVARSGEQSGLDASFVTPGRAELLARRAVTVRLRHPDGGRVRVTVKLRRRGASSIRMTDDRHVTLAAHRTRQVELPLRDAARLAVAKCVGGRLTLSARASDGRLREVSRALRLDAPDCDRFFGGRSVWNSKLPSDAPTDPRSAEITARLVSTVRAGFRSKRPPTINTREYTPPVYAVASGTRRVRVKLDQPPGQAGGLDQAFASVPLPANVRASPGNDRELVVWQPATDTMWEFWQMRRRDDGWHAVWGGRLRHVSSGPGYFTSPHANWGTAATSLPLAGGLITPRDLRRGSIDHALAIGIPMARAREFARPAQRTDGVSTCRNAVPEGARFRLDPRLDIRTLRLSRPVAALARAAQRYGIVVRDQAGAVAFYAQNVASLPSDPYPALFEGRTATELLATFPWSRLQLVRMELVRTPRTGPPLPAPHDVLGGCG